MGRITKLLFVLLIAVTITQCNNINSTPDTDLHFEGEVTYMELEGGFWAVQTDEETYEPTNLPSEFQKDGLEVTVSANIEENMGSIRMVGPIIRIVDIAKR
ncbi:hypothetical protein CK503_12995 [Aliifodinibius salipaludis]|uniref:DUF5666 domain-containing protein n=1 Tax=Fodinibius salipaludis TaxID=2032627 RepID=A0A2A2G626_9BACT|nr:hypothetical protein [Aliifodinibius salipaludis]PAU93081.1 hypothetical protein CK503_12995 [Aliifodinibius salipaludis]